MSTKKTDCFAIIESGSKQYCVSEGTILDIEKLDIAPQNKVDFDKVLLAYVNDKTVIGTPYLDNADVSGVVLNQIKDKKKLVFKFKKKTGYKKTQGHRQRYTTVKIDHIKLKSSSKKQTTSEEKDQRSSEAQKGA